MPMPLSAIVSVPSSVSGTRTMRKSGSSASSSGVSIAMTRSFSQASAAFEMSSRRKTSRFE